MWCIFSPRILAHSTVPGPGTYTLTTQGITILTHPLLRYVVCQVTPITTSEPAMGTFETCERRSESKVALDFGRKCIVESSALMAAGRNYSSLKHKAVTYEVLLSLYSFTKPGAHWRQSVKAGPVHPRQALAHRRQKRLAGTKYSEWVGESSIYTPSHLDTQCI